RTVRGGTRPRRTPPHPAQPLALRRHRLGALPQPPCSNRRRGGIPRPARRCRDPGGHVGIVTQPPHRGAARLNRHRPRRTRSKHTTAAAADTFNDSTSPGIGIDTQPATRSATAALTPSVSPPSTNATRDGTSVSNYDVLSASARAPSA